MLLSMAALMLLLLPILMLVLNPEKTTALPLAMAGSAQDLPPPPPGGGRAPSLQRGGDWHVLFKVKVKVALSSH